MKSVLTVLFFFAVLAGSAQVPERLFRNGTVKLAYRPSPLFYLFNHTNTNKAGSPGWLMVQVTYEAAAQKQYNKAMWLDNVTMETEVALPASYQGKNVTVLLKGKTIFWSIPLDGKKHQAVACIPPQVIARFARKGNKIELQQMLARVTFYTSGRRVLMRVYSSASSRARVFFDQLSGAVTSGVLTVEDIIMPRTKTPWDAVDYEQYDVIKPDPQK
ncbi:MAG: hypothetical protein PHV59_00315 [Victivallales bacterium]|nr:hypothetical protein [Victivallales bacterium]